MFRLVQNLALLAACLMAALPAAAQDKLITQQGATHQGRVQNVDATGVWIDMGGAQSKINRSSLARVEIPMPAEVQEGLKLVQDRKYSAAIPKLEPGVSKYEGLPQEWIEQASYSLARCYLETGNSPKAMEIYNKAQKYYPDSARSATAAVGKARAHLGLKQYDEAIKLLAPLIDEKEKSLGLSDADNLELGSACLTLGECYEAKGDSQKALGCFLKVTALYSADRQAASQALYRSGVVFEQMNNLPRAASQYKEFLRVDAGSPFAGDARNRLQKLEAKLPKDGRQS